MAVIVKSSDKLSLISRHESVLVNLTRKPSWLFERNPLGLVPIIEHKGNVICESTVCNEFLEEAYPGFSTWTHDLLPPCPFKRAAVRLLMLKFDKVWQFACHYHWYQKQLQLLFPYKLIIFYSLHIIVIFCYCCNSNMCFLHLADLTSWREWHRHWKCIHCHGNVVICKKQLFYGSVFCRPEYMAIQHHTRN